MRANHAELRARFVELHGEQRTARAELLGILGAAQVAWQWTEARREEAEELFQAAWLDEQARPSFDPPPWLHGDTYEPRPWRARARRWFTQRALPWSRRPAWAPETWRALAALASASAREAEWAARVAELARAAARQLRPTGGRLA